MAATDERRLRRVLAAASLAMFVGQLDYFALNLALPSMAHDFDSATTDLQWVVSGTMLALGALLIFGGRIADIYGRRMILLTGLGLFAAAALACGLAPTAGVVIAFRVAQGVAVALMFPVAIAVLANAFPEQRRGKAIGLAYGFAAVGSALGPFVGGGLTEALSWRWVFFAMIPLAGAAFVLVLTSVEESRDESVPRHVDLPGVLTVSLGVAMITFAVDRAQTWGWVESRTIAVFGVGVLLLLGFTQIERRARWPLVDLSLFRSRPFDLVVAGCTIANVAFVVMVYTATIYLQQVRGLSPLVAGVVFLAPSIGAGLGGPLAGWLGERFPPRAIVAGANGIGGLGLLGLALLGDDAWPVYLLMLAIAGIGFGVGWAFASVGTQAVVRREIAGEASGVTLTVVIGLGGLAVAAAASALRELGQHGVSASDAITWILVAVAAIALLSALILAALGTGRTTSVAVAGAEPMHRG
jgi:EmrB/QacA subfamily drug resistance transporter